MIVVLGLLGCWIRLVLLGLLGFVGSVNVGSVELVAWVSWVCCVVGFVAWICWVCCAVGFNIRTYKNLNYINFFIKSLFNPLSPIAPYFFILLTPEILLVKGRPLALN